jgi:hypothetical protein
MNRLITTIQEERSGIGLMGDVVKTLWAEMALENGMNDIEVVDYLAWIIQRTALGA